LIGKVVANIIASGKTADFGNRRSESQSRTEVGQRPKTIKAKPETNSVKIGIGDFGSAIGGGKVNILWFKAKIVNLLQAFFKETELKRGVSIGGIVGVGQMGKDPLKSKVGIFLEKRKKIGELAGFETLAVHAGVDFEMNFGGATLGGNGLKSERILNGESQMGKIDFGKIGRMKRADQENRVAVGPPDFQGFKIAIGNIVRKSS